MPDPVTRAEFGAEKIEVRELLHATQLMLLDKFQANHRELLAVLERQSNRINAIQATLARLDERTRK